MRIGINVDSPDFLVKVAIFSSFYFLSIFLIDVLYWMNWISQIQDVILTGGLAIGYSFFMFYVVGGKIRKEMKGL